MNDRVFGSTQSVSQYGWWCLIIWVWWIALDSLPACGRNRSMIVSHKFIAGMPSMCKPASSDTSSASVMLLGYSWSFLTSTWKRHQCMWSENTQNTTWSWLWVRQISCKVSVLEESQFAVCCLLPIVTMLFLNGCVMNVTVETCKSQIARSVPLLWLILQSSLLSKVNLVFLLPNTCIAKQYESKSLTIHPQ